MKWILRAALFVMALIAAIALTGIPAVNHEASRSADFNKPPETVHALISDVKNYSQWWPENEVNVEVVENSTHAVRHQDRGRERVRWHLDNGDHADAERIAADDHRAR